VRDLEQVPKRISLARDVERCRCPTSGLACFAELDQVGRHVSKRVVGEVDAEDDVEGTGDNRQDVAAP